MSVSKKQKEYIYKKNNYINYSLTITKRNVPISKYKFEYIFLNKEN